MQFIDFISPIVRIFILIVFLAAIEWIIPFRQARHEWRRLNVNLSLTLSTIVIFTACFFAIALAVQLVIENGGGLLQLAGLPTMAVLILGVVLLDGVTYLAHILLHKVPLLWALHRVHHADTMVDASTSFRQHPVEAIIRWVFLGLTAILFGIPLAAIALYRLASSANALLEHANIYTPPWLDKVVSLLWVSPRMHKIHHSEKAVETDSNYGNLLSLFDRLFRTFTPVDRAVTVNYGLGVEQAPRRPLSLIPPQSGIGNPRDPWL